MAGKITGLRSRYPLHIQIAALFTLLIVSIGSVIVLFSHSQLSKLTEASTNRQYQKTGEAIAAELDSVTRSMKMSAKMLARMPITEATTLEQRMAFIGPLIEILKQNDYANAVYSAYHNGDFFILRRLTPANRALFNAPEDAEWLAQSYRFLETSPQAQNIFLDGKQQVMAVKTVPYNNYDPRERTWYQLAVKTQQLITSPLYTFKGTGETGFTYSIQAPDGHAVIGLDVSLASLSLFLQQSLPPDSQAAIINSANEAIASLPAQNTKSQDGLNSIAHIPVLQALLDLHHGASGLFTAQGQSWFGAVVELKGQSQGYQLVIATPSAYLTADANAIRNRSTLIAFALLLLGLPLVWYFSLRISRPLIRLRQDADAISNLHFDERAEERSVIEEVDDLHKAMSKMKLTLKQFISMGSLLSTKDNFPQQMQGLLNETSKIANMSGGIIFLSDKTPGCFSPIACNWAGKEVASSEVASLQFDPQQSSAFWQILEGKTVAGVFTSENIPSQLHTIFGSHLPLHYVAVPMQTHDRELMGFLLLLNPAEAGPEHGQAKVQLINALVGSLSVAIETQYLLQEQKHLMGAFIQLIAGAIDAKSAYTGGHCQRVPVITKMLAKAAVEAKQGPFADFTLSANEWEELHTACWLHDCGKITTPEAIVDKATKLEMIYDRIHEVRMRFEVLKRDKEVSFLRKHATIAATEQEEQWLRDELQQLDEDFYFIAQCNIGGEFLSDSALARIQQIAQYQWTRTLDDTAGVAREELARKNRRPAAPLPTQEPLLADKEEHIIYRDEKSHLPESYHFKLKEPTLLYNHGEIYNLGIRRGTLSEEERYKINEHIMQTIIMLEKLPFPRTMANVAVIAGGHHERMDGKGYPYQLTHQQMSIPVRMMAIADVFEALTAADRPYKPGKLLSEALNILVNMANENHLDRELMILFLESGIWHDYALSYLQADKIDTVDIPALLRKLEIPDCQPTN
ncbi:HD domain-containing phosphohydrolase [Serratia fonticola]|uniref:HD domain-containing phosphohydrolase n=1 Tax=Serratia fonticola TaxID=47917 RepID=UPI001AE52602|nr:HD domain-containing phosphohydrolase [Serratia fonticola]MBP1000361.1 metal-dependent phosphohydrolase [Serratia fonticola]MBP1004204.1 metal-dependent phosphohydrolase [Serratia fonticola]MBP1014196.1 metal-dependent phosphohydrolase [Serratia fonticola]